MYDDVLLPTDGSAGMSPVVDHAASLAAEHGATLHALYVVDTASLSDVPLDASFESVARSIREEGESVLADVESRVEEVPVETTVLEGSPARDIVAVAEERPCDVVVMGTHGRSGVDRLLLGSVAERVVRSSSVPVLTIRVGEEQTGT